MVNEYTTALYVQSEIRADTAFSSSTVPSNTDITRWIQEESKFIELKTGQIFSSNVTSSSYFDYDGSGTFRLPYSPILSITELRYNINSLGTTPSWISLEEGYDKNFVLYADEGEVEFFGGSNSVHKITPNKGSKKLCVSYVSGYTSTPLDIQKLCTLLVAKRCILTLINSQSNTEGGDIQVGTIRVSDPSNFSISYMKNLNDEINSLFAGIGQGLNTFRMTRVYD